MAGLADCFGNGFVAGTGGFHPLFLCDVLVAKDGPGEREVSRLGCSMNPGRILPVRPGRIFPGHTGRILPRSLFRENCGDPDALNGC